MLSIRDFPQCPRYTWIASYFEHLDAQKVKAHLIVMTALLAYDGITMNQIADMFSFQKTRLGKSLVGLRKESFVYDGVQGRLHLRGDRPRFLWPTSNGLPTEEFVSDYETLRSLLKESQKREQRQDISHPPPVQSTPLSEKETPPLQQQFCSETLELHKKFTQVLLRFEQVNHLKKVDLEPHEGAGPLDNEQAKIMVSEAEDAFNMCLQESVNHMSKSMPLLIRNVHPCMVCLQPLEEMSVIHKCGHVLCRACADTMKARNKSELIECPKCKKLGRPFRLYI